MRGPRKPRSFVRWWKRAFPSRRLINNHGDRISAYLSVRGSTSCDGKGAPIGLTCLQGGLQPWLLMASFVCPPNRLLKSQRRWLTSSWLESHPDPPLLSHIARKLLGAIKKDHVVATSLSSCTINQLTSHSWRRRL